MLSSIRRRRPAAAAISLGVTGLLLAGCVTGTNNVGATSAPTTTPTSEATQAPGGTDAPSASTEPSATAVGREVPVAISGAVLDPNAGTIEVRGTVTQVIGDGTCIVTAVNSEGAELVAQTAAVPDAQSTVCPPVLIEGVTGDDWTVTLSVQGEDFHGESEPVAAEVE